MKQPIHLEDKKQLIYGEVVRTSEACGPEILMIVDKVFQEAVRLTPFYKHDDPAANGATTYCVPYDCTSIMHSRLHFPISRRVPREHSETSSKCNEISMMREAFGN